MDFTVSIIAMDFLRVCFFSEILLNIMKISNKGSVIVIFHEVFLTGFFSDSRSLDLCIDRVSTMEPV